MIIFLSFDLMLMTDGRQKLTNFVGQQYRSTKVVQLFYDRQAIFCWPTSRLHVCNQNGRFVGRWSCDNFINADTSSKEEEEKQDSVGATMDIAEVLKNLTVSENIWHISLFSVCTYKST